MNSYKKQKAKVAELRGVIKTLSADLFELVINPESQSSASIKQRIYLNYIQDKQLMLGSEFVNLKVLSCFWTDEQCGEAQDSIQKMKDDL